MIYFLDTSAILNQAHLEYKNTWISPTVLKELENIKNSCNKDESIKYLARQAVRDIILSKNYNYFVADEIKIKKIMKKYRLLENNTDHRILAEAILLQQQNENKLLTLVTSDGSLYLFANTIKQIECEYFFPHNRTQENYYGWKNYYPDIEQMTSLYSSPNTNILNCYNNEFAKIFEDNVLKDVLFWNGEQYEKLKYKEFRNAYTNDIIKPRNIEQKMLFHLLQNDKIKIKLCCSTYGAGKTFIMLQHALRGIKDGQFSKIVFVRNNIITKGSRDIGFIKGSILEKMRPFLMPLADLTSEEYLDEIIETGILEPVPLSFMRGRDFSGNVLVFVDEAENLTKENIQLLIGRLGTGSELYLAGDLKQIDHYEFEKNNGIRAMINKLKGNELFGMVKLVKSERSKTAELSNLLD